MPDLPARLRALLAARRPAESAEPTDGDWPWWRGPDRTGVSAETEWESEGAPEALWTVNVGRGYSSPSIAGGRLYTRGFVPAPRPEGEEEEDDGEDAGLGEDFTYCLDALTGEEIWRHASPARLFDNMHGGGTLTTPTVDGNTVFVLGRLGSLWALDAADGSVRWEKDLNAELQAAEGFFGLSSSPVVVGDVLYLNVGVTAAFDKGTGKLLWRTEDYGYSYGTPMPFEREGRPLLAIFNAVGLVVLARTDGTEVARFDWTSGYNVNSATPIVIEDLIFISTGYDEIGCTLLQLTDDGLEPVWASKAMSNLMNGCVLVDGHLIGFDVAVLKSLDLEGNERWVKRGLGRGTVVASRDGRLIVLSEDGHLIVGADGDEAFEKLSSTKVLDEGPCWTTPVLAGGVIYCRSATGLLTARDHRPR